MRTSILRGFTGRNFFGALLWSQPHGLIVATIAFPAALIAFSIGVAIIWLVPVLLLVPFLLQIMVFPGSHFSRTATILLSFEARFLARLEGSHPADRFGLDETETDYRSLRKRWGSSDAD